MLLLQDLAYSMTCLSEMFSRWFLQLSILWVVPMFSQSQFEFPLSASNIICSFLIISDISCRSEILSVSFVSVNLTIVTTFLAGPDINYIFSFTCDWCCNGVCVISDIRSVFFPLKIPKHLEIGVGNAK